jgi:hypothetical protein
MKDDRSIDRSTPGDSERDADNRFLDALLQHHYQADESAGAERIAIALRNIDGTAGSAPRGGVPWWYQALRFVAAAIVVGALLMVPTALSNTASAAIDRAMIAMSRMVDLHYQLEIETPLGEVSGEIWFRGSDLVALRLDTAAGSLWAGEGQDAAWVVPPVTNLSVRVNDKGTLLDVLQSQNDVKAPFLRISTMLERLGGSFEFEFGPDGETVEARRMPGAPDHLPEQVSVRLAPDGVVREFEAHLSRILGPRGCRLTWLDDDAKPAAFYEHAAHHDQGRDVIDLR